MDAAPQFDRVCGHVCDEEGKTITRMGRVRVGTLGLWTCFVFFQTRDKVSLTSYLTSADTKGFPPTKNRTKHGHNPACQPLPRKICEVEPSIPTGSCFVCICMLRPKTSMVLGSMRVGRSHPSSDHVADEG